LKATADPEWIAQVRQRYPVEPALDKVFTRKMTCRSSGGNHRHYSLEETGRQLEACIGTLFDGELSIEGLRPLSGGASQEQYYFEVRQRNGDDVKVRRLVLRREPDEAICAANRLREFQLMRAATAVAPVPFPHFVDEDGVIFGRPSMICDFASGVQKPSSGSGNVSGIGILFGPALREKLAPQFIQYLAAIHTLDLSRATVDALHQPVQGRQRGNGTADQFPGAAVGRGQARSHPAAQRGGALAAQKYAGSRSCVDGARRLPQRQLPVRR